MSDTKEKLANYIDAGVPILYINSFEEKKQTVSSKKYLEIEKLSNGIFLLEYLILKLRNVSLIFH